MDIYKCPKTTFRKKVLDKKNKKNDSDLNAANENFKKCRLLSQLFFLGFIRRFFIYPYFRRIEKKWIYLKRQKTPNVSIVKNATLNVAN